MSKPLQQAFTELNAHKYPPAPPSEQPQNNKSISVPSIQMNRSVSTYEAPTLVVGSGWLNGHHLRHASSFHVVQKADLHQGVTLGGLEQCNEYTVMDQAGNNVFFINEESVACCTPCGYRNRPFTLIVKDNLGTNAFVMDHGLVCSCCCGLDKLTVVTPAGRLLGIVKEEFALLRPVLAIEDATGQKVLQMRGPRWPGSCCGKQVVFQVQTLQGLTVGTISKDSNPRLTVDGVLGTVHVSFPSDLDPATKAVCLGALFLIDEFLEWTRTKKQRGREQKAIDDLIIYKNT